MKKLSTVLALGLASAALPFTVHAQSFNGNVLGSYLSGFIDFINAFLIPFIWAIAFIVFIWGVFQYFIAGGANEEQRDKGKQLVFWGVIAFVVMTSLWGIVNLFVNTLDFRGENTPPIPTFDQNGSSANRSNSNGSSNAFNVGGSGNSNNNSNTGLNSNPEGIYDI